MLCGILILPPEPSRPGDPPCRKDNAVKYTLTGAQAKAVDRDTIERIGIPSLVLMERAALAVADTVCEYVPEKHAVIYVACGTGNNGADGIAAARILKERGYEPAIILTGHPDHATEEWKTQRQIAERFGVNVVPEQNFFEEAVSLHIDVIVDALFGIGLSREVGGSYRRMIETIFAHTEAKVIAVDIASGIHSDTGAIMGAAVKADITVTFGYQKTGMLLYPGRSFSGEVRVAEIGFSDVSLPVSGTDTCLLEKADLKRLPARRPDGNKGTFGKLLLIAGSDGMSGAAYLSALAAYRTGAGLVHILTVESNRAILQTLIPEAVVISYDPQQIAAFQEHPEDEERDSEDYRSEERRLESEEQFQEMICQQCDWADAIVMGPGLGQKPYVLTLVETVLEHAYVPVILDADGLNTLAKHTYLNRFLTENIIITPHIGEMARLTGTGTSEIKEMPVKTAREYSAQTGVICVLKDAATVIADKDGNTWLNTSGCAAMAKAGSGDVLTGVIGALSVQGMDNIDAAVFGVYLHGLAGEAAAAAEGDRSVLAGDIANHIFKETS
jgi:NAD(P)H-hydrate epimerase